MKGKFFMTRLKQIKINTIWTKKAAEISALSSGELEKYEYLTGEDLGYKPEVAEKGFLIKDKKKIIKKKEF